VEESGRPNGSGLKEGLSRFATGAHGAVDGGGIAVVPTNPGSIREAGRRLSKGIVPGILAGEGMINGVALEKVERKIGLPETGADFGHDGLGIGSKSGSEGNGKEGGLAGGIAGDNITGYGEI